MRLLFMLLALLYGLASSAQQACQIGDLAAGFVLSDSVNCKYSVKLNFQHQGTTNQFNVKGNGVNYGTFAYTALPVTIGPIMGQANAPTVREFVVTDALLGCSAFTTLTLPACSPAATCEIYDASATAGACLPSGGFPLQINFKVQNPGNELFEVWAENGSYLGIFPLAALPLKLPNYPSNGSPSGKVKVCINDRPDCCKVIEFQAPLCAPQCGWQVEVDTGKCTSDSTYAILVHLAAPAPAPPTDSFQIFGNGRLLGTYAWNQLPINIPNFPSAGGAFDIIRVCAVKDSSNTGGAVCCVEQEFLAPKCVGYPDCAISRIQLKTDSCTSDSTFRLTLNFMVADTMQVDSFSVFADGKFLGKYALSQLPLTLTDYPWVKGTIYSNVRVCTGDLPGCCRERKFAVPPCLPFGPCHVTDIQIKAGPCRADGSFQAVINFQATNPGNGTFTVFGNGQNLGTFPVAVVPVVVNFPSNGAALDVVKICVNLKDPNTTPCCESKQFEGPDCPGSSCAIEDLVVQVGDCNPDGTFKAVVKFGVKNPTSDKFFLFSNGQLIGSFNLSQLPLALNLPSNGAALDVVKVCLLGNVPTQTPCCAEVSFEGPTCGSVCEIYNLKIEPGICTSDSTYKAVIRFDVFNPPSTKFAVVVNGVNLGIYDLSQLPLTLNNLPSNGASTDVLKVCMVVPGALTCCRTLEYQGPICGNQNCEIYNLTAQVGDCTSDSTYKLTLNFQVNNPGNSLFEVWAGGTKYLGAFPLSQLPLVIPNYPEGNAYHFVKVCINDHPNCCRTVQFVGRNCGAACEITNLSVVTGLCTGDSTYKVTINFGVNNPLTDMFSVVGNGHFLGFYKLGQLPLTLEFPWNGGNFDLIEVCAVTAPGIACCKKIEFAVPDCILHPVCEIYDLTVQTGDCTSDSSYQAKVNFKVTGSSAQTFTLWANGQVLGTYNLSQLPLAIQNFPWNGGLFDAVKVCMNNPDPAAPPCCRTKEFAVPNCLSQCDIVDLEMLVGDCTSDSTYKVKINFQVIGSSSNVFGVWVNGQNIGFYNLSQLPLTLTVHSDGGLTDAIKVCLMGNNMGQVLCCRTQEVEVPGCIDMNCHIWDVQVLKTPCLCGKFFAIVSFQHQHGGAGGFDIMGNGQNYGNFPYSATQPIILGPLMGDGTTPYEFVVKDHLHPDCRDFAVLGKVECSTPTDELAGSSGHMLLSPNPAKDRLNVTAQLDGKALVGSAQVEVRHADGRLLQTLSVAEGSNFSLDVSTLPAGVYRLTLMADGGRLEASFVKAD